MQSIKGTLLLLTLCLSANGIWANSHFIGELLKGVAEAGKDIGELALDVTQEGTEALEQFLGTLKTANSDFLNNAGDIGKAIRENLVLSLDTFEGNLKTALEDIETRLKKERNTLNKALLQDGKEALNKLNKTVNVVQAELAGVNQKVAETVNNQVEEIYNVLNDWETTQHKRLVNGSEGHKIIADLIERYNFVLRGCIMEVEFIRVEFEYMLQAQIEKYQGISQQLLTEVAQCTKQLITNPKCRSRFNELAKELSNAPKDLLDVFTNKKIIENADEAGKTCAKTVIAQVEIDVTQAQAALDKLIAEQGSE